LKAALQIIRQNCIDVVIVRDLPLAVTALLAGHMTNTPVCMDMAENYVALLEDTWTYEPFRPLNVLIRNPKLARHVERFVIKTMDCIIVVVEEARQRLLAEGVPSYKIEVVATHQTQVHMTNIHMIWNCQILTS